MNMDFRKIGFVGMDWTDLAKDRDKWRDLVNLTVLRNIRNFCS
jgi:hypothetical protein